MVKKKKKNVKGVCHICNEREIELTYEHIPPKSSFNKSAIKKINYEKYFKGTELKNLKYRTNQKGGGEFTLCKKCNSQTGLLYGTAFKSWSIQINNNLFQIPEKITQEIGQTKFFKIKIHPLRVLKQIVSLFLSINNEEAFKGDREKLKVFVLNKNEDYLPENLEIYCYALSPISFFNKQLEMQSIMFLDGRKYLLSEISHQPAGYILSYKDDFFSNINNEKKLINITFFKKYKYEDQIELNMYFPIFPNNTPYIFDFRTKIEMKNKFRDFEKEEDLINMDTFTDNLIPDNRVDFLANNSNSIFYQRK